ncbi:lipase family protein [Streptosporangium canum]|uniref:lipase family protein n=1 Tax=Streptosporangium canum TaxID=324952 RepID=UPI0034486C55
MNNRPEIPLNIPPGYKMDIAKTCSFVVNVACDMCHQWIADNKPKPEDFSWNPTDSCPVTNSTFPIGDWSFQAPLWSTFSLEKVTEPFAIIAYGSDPKTAFLAFRGTQTPEDAAMDLLTNLVTYKPPTQTPITNAKVADGFYAVFNGFDALKAKLSEIASKDHRLVVTGHSLGSTLATLTVPLACSVGIPSTNILHYNQASPKVGEVNFRNYYDRLDVLQTFRLRNKYDTVPDWPDKTEYVPVGVEVEYGADYSSEPKNHNPCCSYSYALFNPTEPYNRNFDKCMSQSKPTLYTP